MDKKETTDELLASRLAVYGDRVENMERTAALWSALLGVEILDWQVPLMMSAYKMLRTFETPNYSDNTDDIDGWKKMFVEVMEANHGGIIQARTVEEYQRKRADRIAWDAAVDANKMIRESRVEDYDPVVMRIEEFEFTKREWEVIRQHFNNLQRPRHPYENVERDAERDAVEAFVKHRENYVEPK